jgi:large subunit ribosomal protein L23
MSSNVEKKKVSPTPEDYTLIVAPIVTEKSQIGSENNKYTFFVAPSADKLQIKRAVERIFGVVVKTVNVLNRNGKVKRFKGVRGVQNATRRAVVTLAEGQSLDITS